MRFLLGLAVFVIGSIEVNAEVSSDRDAYGGVRTLKGLANGWFHVEQIDGR